MMQSFACVSLETGSCLFVCLLCSDGPRSTDRPPGVSTVAGPGGPQGQSHYSSRITSTRRSTDHKY